MDTKNIAQITNQDEYWYEGNNGEKTPTEHYEPVPVDPWDAALEQLTKYDNEPDVVFS